jgi:hypothetical protein
LDGRDTLARVTPPLARTNAEAHLYMDLQPCETCGEHGFTGESAVVLVDGLLCSRYTGDCRRCGTRRQFVFRLPEEIRLPVERDIVFGGPEPSELLDPGEWLTVADRAASMPASGDPQADREDVALAAAAVDEVLKFVPDGVEEVPATAFRSDTGHRMYAEEPGRFRRGRLAAVASTYRGLASRS